jgi:hypothetical protein
MPTEDEIAGFVSAISTKYPALTYCWGAIDGLKLRLYRDQATTKYKIYFSMVGRMTTMCVAFFCFLLMGK